MQLTDIKTVNIDLIRIMGSLITMYEGVQNSVSYNHLP
ncbi:hypothetical protein VIAQ111709_13705 [Vibrio aquimaris]|uniref:Uncharacterized protein n=1 Tax=Vibrio aquimaris TaxID=2587862 RepID=A0A5P9CND3_9VIBR|nr:hypothetical protein FIV01_15115 [Vibrio aquimaris]